MPGDPAVVGVVFCRKTGAVGAEFNAIRCGFKAVRYFLS
jgi:hypothetical protein